MTNKLPWFSWFLDIKNKCPRFSPVWSLSTQCVNMMMTIHSDAWKIVCGWLKGQSDVSSKVMTAGHLHPGLWLPPLSMICLSYIYGPAFQSRHTLINARHKQSSKLTRYSITAIIIYYIHFTFWSVFRSTVVQYAHIFIHWLNFFLLYLLDLKKESWRSSWFSYLQFSLVRTIIIKIIMKNVI